MAPTVQLVEVAPAAGDAYMRLGGVETCGSVWSCPLCAARILAERAHDISTAVAEYGAQRCWLVTLTIRHQPGLDPYIMRRVLRDAYGRLKAGRAGKRMRNELGWAGDCAALEVTHGPSGWHPHLHAVWFAGESEPESWALSDAWQRAVESTVRAHLEVARHPDTVSFDRLRAIVGVRHVAQPERYAALLERADLTPSTDYGVTVVPCSDGTYIHKMGLEVAGGGVAKTAAPGHRTAWQIAADAPSDKASRGLWRQYSAAMFGARQVVWSRAIRAELGLRPTRSDELAAALPPEQTEERLLVEIDGDEWTKLARSPGWLPWLARQYADGALRPGAALEDLRAAWRTRVRAGPEPPVVDVDGAARRGAGSWRASQARREHRRTRRFVDAGQRAEAREELYHHLALDIGIAS